MTSDYHGANVLIMYNLAENQLFVTAGQLREFVDGLERNDVPANRIVGGKLGHFGDVAAQVAHLQAR